MAPVLTAYELAELQAAFAGLLNHESDNPFTPIDPLTYRASDGDTCLHLAAHRGNIRAVELLIKAGLDINQPGDMGYTPLHYASTPEVIAFLLLHGASPSIRNELGNLPLTRA